MDSPLSVLLRDGTHTGATTRLALKAEQFAITTTRTPIQIPMPKHSPFLFDFGFNRPAITVSGLIDNIGGDNTNSTVGYENMEKFVLDGQTYYIPYKNYFEKFLTESTKYGDGFECEFGNAAYPISTQTNASTGGGIYTVVIGQFQFTIAPGTEDRWVYSLSLPAMVRQDITFD